MGRSPGVVMNLLELAGHRPLSIDDLPLEDPDGIRQS
jgi:hypothetical protein